MQCDFAEKVQDFMEFQHAIKQDIDRRERIYFESVVGEDHDKRAQFVHINKLLHRLLLDIQSTISI